MKLTEYGGRGNTPRLTSLRLSMLMKWKKKTCIVPKNSALMFCYFNNIELFHKYLDQYKGPCVILVGPVDGARHCDPEPAYLEDISDWELQNNYSLKEEDQISVYR